MSKEPLKPPAADPARPTPGGEDELIHAPRGMRKSRVVMGVLLIITLLTFFWQGDALLSSAGRRSSVDDYMSYRPAPSATVRTVSERDFVTEKQAFNKFAAIAYGMKMDSDQATASYILMSDVAEAAGVRVTDEELKEFIRSRFPTNTPNAYRDALARYRTSPREFEETLRRFLRIERYQNLLAASLATPDPAEIEKLWKTRHQEYSFDYVELPVEKLREDAAKEAPDPAALKAWFEALPEPERKTYETEAAVGGEVAGFPLKDERPVTALIEKYPLASGTDLEALAKQYYTDFQYVRFRDPDFVFPQSGQVDPQKLFLTWEKAEDTARREAPIYQAMGSWLADMTARASRGEAVDVAAEAKALGLEYAAQTEPKTYAEWSQVRTESGWIGGSIVSSFFDNGKNGEFLPAAMVDETSIGIGRTSEKREAAMPAFEEIEGKVRDTWITRRAGELAVAKLEALRDAFGTRPPADDTTAPPFRPEAEADAFAAAVAGAGLEVSHADWAERNAVAAEDGPFERFLRQRSDLYTLKEATVAKAELAADKERAYLVRVAGVRDADAAKMTPADVQMLSRQIATQAMDEFRTKTFRDQKFLEERYALKLASLREDPSKAN